MPSASYVTAALGHLYTTPTREQGLEKKKKSRDGGGRLVCLVPSGTMRFKSAPASSHPVRVAFLEDEAYVVADDHPVVLRSRSSRSIIQRTSNIP